MSWLETTPKLTPTEQVAKPLQKLFGLPDAQQRNFGDLPANFMRPTHGTKVTQLKFSDIPLKERFVETIEWPIGTTNPVLWYKEINMSFLSSFMERTLDTFMLMDIDEITFTIRTNANAAYQGLMWLIWEPTPSSNWFHDIYDYSISLAEKSQLQRLEITPNTSGEYSFTIPIIYPFDMFLNPNLPTNAASDSYIAMMNYTKNYTFGRIYLQNIISLESSNTTAVSLCYPISFSITGFNYGATNYNLR